MVQGDKDVIDEIEAILSEPAPVEDSVRDSDIGKFYANRTVFLTGATGFIGKALVEKLIRSCPGIKRICILVREKKNLTVNERLETLVSSKVFDRLRKNGGISLKEKLYLVQGDITKERLGISDEDMHLLASECSIVLNSAASVRFSEPLDAAVEINIQSVGELIEFCNSLENLEAIVHLSTAYSNCHKKDTIHEVLYKPPMKGAQIQRAVQVLKVLNDGVHVHPDGMDCTTPRSDDNIERDACVQQHFYTDRNDYVTLFEERKTSGTCCMVNGNDNVNSSVSHKYANRNLLEEFTKIALRRSNKPNTYTFTKAISEDYLVEKLNERPDRYLRGKIPVAIVRPSIVGAAWREPCPGYVDSYSGPANVILCIYTGSKVVFPGRSDFRVDLVPVDMVANLVLSAAWYISREKLNCNSKVGSLLGIAKSDTMSYDRGILIFNFVSSFRNPMKWRTIADTVSLAGLKYPSKFLSRVPSTRFVRNRCLYYIADFFLDLIPAKLMDLFIKSPLNSFARIRHSAMQVYMRTKQLSESLSPFILNQWHFSDYNVRSLYENLSETDKRLFHFDVNSIIWRDYMRNYAIGVRVYLQQDELQSVPTSIARLKKIRMFNWSVLSLVVILLYLFLAEY